MLITHTQTHIHIYSSTTKNVIFRYREPQSVKKTSKSPFRKFDLKTLISLPYMDNGKQKYLNVRKILVKMPFKADFV